MKKREAILFRAHRATPGAIACFRRLFEETQSDFDLWIVGRCHSPTDLQPYAYPRVKSYDEAVLSTLPYTHRARGEALTAVHGYNDLPVLQFFREEPSYARYWIIEYDVRYTGNWRWLLQDCGRSAAGLLGTTVMRWSDNPAWANWQGVSTGPDPMPRTEWVKAFLPFAGVTSTLLAAIDARYQRGWAGHYEASWPMAAVHAGLGVEDIGGSGPFVPPGRERRHYWNTPLDPHLRPGSFVFRPTVVSGQSDQSWTGMDEATLRWQRFHLGVAVRLVHPVKD